MWWVWTIFKAKQKSSLERDIFSGLALCTWKMTRTFIFTSLVLFQSSAFNIIILIDLGKQVKEMSFCDFYSHSQWNQNVHQIKKKKKAMAKYGAAMFKEKWYCFHYKIFKVFLLRVYTAKLFIITHKTYRPFIIYDFFSCFIYTSKRILTTCEETDTVIIAAC